MEPIKDKYSKALELQIKEAEESKGKYAILTINQAESGNALSSGLLAALEVRFDEIAENVEIRVLIITGKGKFFIAGADIKEIDGLNKKQAFEYSRKGQLLFNKLEKLKAVTIAAINGYALGGGLELALSCDIRVASGQAHLGQVEARLGLIPGFGGTQRLAQIVGLGWAKYMLLTGQSLAAQKCLDIGLISELTHQDNLLEVSENLAGKIMQNGPKALFCGKRIFQTTFHKFLDEGLRHEAQEFANLFPENRQEHQNEVSIGVKAFLEKNQPKWL